MAVLEASDTCIRDSATDTVKVTPLALPLALEQHCHLRNNLDLVLGYANLSQL